MEPSHRSVSARFARACALGGALVTFAASTSDVVAQVVPVSTTEGARAARVIVNIVGIRSDRGEVTGGLYSRAERWLEANRADEDCHASIRGHRARCVFARPTTARFAFAAMHDEDHDGELDRDMVGIPQEGYAFSNDVREPFGPPNFRAASFPANEITVHMRYGI